MFILGFPLLLIPFAIYNMIAFLTPGVGWTAPVATIHMMSGQDWVLTYEDLLIAFAILLLAVEIMKATRMGMRTIVDHILAMALFIVMLIEFLLVRQAGTSTFFLLTMIAWSTCSPASSSASAARSGRSRSTPSGRCNAGSGTALTASARARDGARPGAARSRHRRRPLPPARRAGASGSAALAPPSRSVARENPPAAARSRRLDASRSS